MKISKLGFTLMALGLLCGIGWWLGAQKVPRGLGAPAMATWQLPESRREDEMRHPYPVSQKPSPATPPLISDQELQRILGVPEQAWTGNLKQLARLLEDGRDGEANELLDQWLETDFEGALLAMPFMMEFRYRFGDAFPAEVFVRHLRELNGSARMDILGLLGYGNPSVRLVTSGVMKDWWEQSPDTMMNWIQRTPSFTDYSLLQEFLTSVNAPDGDYSTLAYTFYSLDANDPRRLRFIDQIMEQWMNADFNTAQEFMNTALLLESRSAATYANDPSAVSPVDVSVPDQTIARFAFSFADGGDIETALNWMGRITNVASRELYLRDLSYKAVSNADRHIFSDWIKANPIKAGDLRQQILKNLDSPNG